MAMGAGGGTGRSVSDMNVTPLIDVLLVLLVIFMIIVPQTAHGLPAIIPQPPKSKSAPPPEQTIVVSIRANPNGQPSYLINQTPFSKSELEPKLVSIFSTRQQRVMFIKADPSLDYGTVAQVINMGHAADVDNIGIITPAVERAAG